MIVTQCYWSTYSTLIKHYVHAYIGPGTHCSFDKQRRAVINIWMLCHLIACPLWPLQHLQMARQREASITTQPLYDGVSGCRPPVTAATSHMPWHSVPAQHKSTRTWTVACALKTKFKKSQSENKTHGLFRNWNFRNSFKNPIYNAGQCHHSLLHIEVTDSI